MRRPSWPRWLGYVAIGTSALILRLLYLGELSGTPLFSVVIGDGRQYVAWAKEVAGGQWIGTSVFYQAPLYPYVLALIFRIAGESLFVVRLVQAVLGAASCVLVAHAGRRFFDDRSGRVAGWLLAVYPPAIFFDGLLQKSSLDLFLVSLTLALLGEFVSRRGWAPLAGAGAALGALVLNRENARVLYPVVVLWIWWYFGDAPARMRAAWMAAFTAAALAVVVPVGLRNHHVGGEFLISSSQAGSNFYIGNHAGAHGSYEPLVPNRGNVAFERDDATRLAQKAAGRSLSPGEVSDYWLGRALADIRSLPAAWLRLLGRKLLLTFSAAELVDTESIEIYAEHSRVLGALIWLGFGVVFPLAVVGAWLTRSDWRRLALLYALAGGLALSVAVFYVLARYRFPLVPVLVLFAGGALSRLPASIRDWRKVVPAFALGAIAAVVSYLPLAPAADETCQNLGTALVDAGRPADAISWLERAVAAAPGYAAAHFNLGVALDRAGRKPDALREFAAAVALGPDDAESREALGLTLRELGRAGDALPEFEAAARLAPDSAAARENLALALAEAGRHADAIREFREALRLRPGYVEAHANLAVALASTGDRAAAVEHMREAARLQPGRADFHGTLADLLTDLGRGEDALGEYEQADRLAPDSLDAVYALAQAYARSGRWQEALHRLEKAVAIARAGRRDDALAEIEGAIQACKARLAGR